MNNNLARSAYTPIIYEMKDCSVGIFNRDGRPARPGAGAADLPREPRGRDPRHHRARSAALDVYREGDVFAVNDSYLTGSHLNDVSVFSPVFHERRARRVLRDEGALARHRSQGPRPGDGLDRDLPGGLPARADPPLPRRRARAGDDRLPHAEQSALALDLGRHARADRRLPDRRAAARRALRPLRGRHDRGRDDSIFAQSERLDREAVARVADGEYLAEGALDSHGPGGDPVPVKVRVTVAGDEMTIDLAGSSPQTPGCMNCGMAQTISAARLAYKFLFNPDVPVTGGHVPEPEPSWPTSDPCSTPGSRRPASTTTRTSG